MKLKTLRIQNLRSFKDETIEFDDLNVFIGPNGAGKSTILTALNILFRENSETQTDVLNLTTEDFHKKNISEPITITATFSNLSDDAKEDFKEYVRQGLLIVSATATFDADSGNASVAQQGQRLGMREFAQFFAKMNDSEPVSQLKPVYAALQDKYSDLPNWRSKEKAKDALHRYEADNPDKCVPIPSRDQFYGYTKGSNRLEKYIQWVYVPAVKDALAESLESRGGALKKLLARTVRLSTDFDESLSKIRETAIAEYTKLLEGNEQELKKLGKALTNRLHEWAHPEASIDLKWNVEDAGAVSVKDPSAKVVAGEGPFTGDLGRLGHGFQRSYIIALLQELAVFSGDEGPVMLLACEEPELYQHPPQSRHLASVFQALSKANNQILVCTHSPHFVPSDNLGALQAVSKQAGVGEASVTRYTYDELSTALRECGVPDKRTRASGIRAKLHQQLQPQLNEMFFCSVPVLVEGLEDIAYLSAVLLYTNQWEEFRRLGCHFIHVDGKDKLISPMAICKGLKIPYFVIWDSDAHASKPEHLARHKIDNEIIQRIVGYDDPEAFPQSTLMKDNHVAWKTCIGDRFAEDVSIGELNDLVEQVRLQYEHTAGIQKNSLYVGDLVLKLAEEGHKSKSLESAVDNILSYAKQSQSPTSGLGRLPPAADEHDG